jgi:signal transduction histidine kinase/PAS domain-containing protein
VSSPSVGPWPEPPHQALVLPLKHGVSGAVQGVIALGVSARLALDDDYRAFLDAVAREIAVRAHAATDRGLEVEQLRLLFDQAPGFMAFLRWPNHVFELVNDAYRALIGAGREVLGKPIREALPDIIGQVYVQLLDEVAHTRKPFVGRGMTVQLARGAQGELENLVVDFIFQPILRPDGTTLGIFVQGNEVTVQKRAEVRQRFLVDVGDALIAEPTMQQALISASQAAARSFSDWCFVDLIDDGRSRRIAASHADPSKVELAERAFAFPPPAELAFDPVRMLANGQTLLVDLNAALLSKVARSPEHLRWLHDVGMSSAIVTPLAVRGHIVGVVSFVLSESRRRYEESDLITAKEFSRRFSTAMDNRLLAAERDELLESERLARERAESANQAKDEFLAMLSHELRNPLSPILTAVELMKYKGKHQFEREQTIIERQGRHLVRLVDDLLDMSRIARGKIELKKAPVRVNAFVTKAIEMASPLLEKRHHVFTSELADNLFVDGDEARLAQVVTNLVTNAARYTNVGGRISLAARADGDAIVITVRDNGVGIPAEMMPRIFDLFVQGAQKADRAEGGLGLGLTLVRRLVGMHGGTVQAHSEGPGRGSEFEIRLPRLTPAVVPVERRSHTTDPGLARRVLLVDDNIDAVEIMKDVLASRGHIVVTAHDGPTALRAAAEFKPEVAVLDIGLPVMDGYELATLLRAQLGSAPPRLIALTGYGQESDRARTRAAGFDTHLVKPVEIAELVRSIR